MEKICFLPTRATWVSLLLCMKSLIQTLSSLEWTGLRVASHDGREDGGKAILEDCELVMIMRRLRHKYQITSLYGDLVFLLSAFWNLSDSLRTLSRHLYKVTFLKVVTQSDSESQCWLCQPGHWHWQCVCQPASECDRDTPRRIGTHATLYYLPTHDGVHPLVYLNPALTKAQKIESYYCFIIVRALSR